MDWFEEWFESPLYEKLYADRDEQEAAQLIALLEDVLSLEQSSTILDLGCGRGRHAIQLCQKGYKVTGIDLSERAITKAKEKAKTLTLENARFEVRDMRNPLPDTFDAVFNLFTTFGYFETDYENARVFDSVTQMLKPGGDYVFDFFNAAKVQKSVQPSDEGTFQGVHYDIRRYVEDKAIYKKIVFTGEDIEGSKEYTERVKLYKLPWLRQQMSDRGLIIDHIYGDYEGTDFDPDSSDRLLIMSHLEGDR